MKKTYDAEYKTEICKRVIETGASVASVAREVGVNENTLYTWVQRYKENSKKPFVGSGNIKPENEELIKLKKEIKDLREENEILKKAATYFAKNQK